MWRKVPPEHVVASSGVGVEVAGVAEEKEEEEHEKKEQRQLLKNKLDELTGEAHATLDCAFPQKREREREREWGRRVCISGELRKEPKA